MGNSQIPNLPAVAGITPDSLFECVVGGQSVKVTAQQIIDSIVGPYLPTAGGTMTGQINGITPVAAANLTRKDYVDAADANMAKTNVGNTFTQDQTIANIDPTINLNDTDAVVGGSNSSRYYFYAGGVINGFCGYSGTQLNLETPQGSVGIRSNYTNLGVPSFIYFSVDGTVSARVDSIGTVSGNSLTVITREKGDARYAPIPSDARYKENVVDMEPTDAAFMALRPVNFSWKENEDDPKPVGTQYGLIAQEVYQVFPTVVRGSEDTMYGLDPLSLIGILIQQVQQLNAKVNALEKAKGKK